MLRSFLEGSDEVVAALLRAISDFLADAEQSISLFEQQYGRRDLLRAWREKIIPQRGKVLRKYEYQMHGIGCWMDLITHEVDFDFTSEGTVGFDAWRIGLYVEQLPETYLPLVTMEDVKVNFPKLLEQQLIEPVSGIDNSYRLTSVKPKRRYSAVFSVSTWVKLALGDVEKLFGRK